ncbi:unnamed protein product [Lactuca virosa]|uniref:Uncharacterized protein n=1 Tax=Lactuca virosa TaxID=75947 RepID=A0AAU9NQG6_9ASTR|nr:unnamed protein product [Lactuca virosa]
MVRDDLYGDGRVHQNRFQGFGLCVMLFSSHRKRDIRRSVHLVELCETGEFFVMKAMNKSVMLKRNKILSGVEAHSQSRWSEMMSHHLAPSHT